MFRNVLTKTNLPNLCLNSIRTKIYPDTYLEPIVDKNELDSLKSNDTRHYKQVKPPNGIESNSLFYNSRLNKFTKMIMKKGEYSTARNIIEKTFYKIKLKQVEKLNKETDEAKRSQIEANPLNIFLQALDNCKPLLKLEPVNKGGITYQCPMPMSEREREFKAIKFIINSCLEKDRGMRFFDALANELLDAYQFQGKSIKKKIDLHKLAEQNRAYAHYRWQKN